MTESRAAGSPARPGAIAGALREALGAIESLRSASPAYLDDSARRLARAAEAVETWRAKADPAHNNTGRTADLQALRSVVRHAARLLDHAAGFHLGWERRKGALTAGYTAGGGVAPPGQVSGRICVSG